MLSLGSIQREMTTRISLQVQCWAGGCPVTRRKKLGKWVAMSPVFSYLTKAFILMRILFPLRRILAPFEHHQYKSKEARSILVFRELKVDWKTWRSCCSISLLSLVTSSTYELFVETVITLVIREFEFGSKRTWILKPFMLRSSVGVRLKLWTRGHCDRRSRHGAPGNCNTWRGSFWPRSAESGRSSRTHPCSCFALFQIPDQNQP